MSGILVPLSFCQVHYCLSFTGKGEKKTVNHKVSLEGIRVDKTPVQSEFHFRAKAKIL